MPNSIGHNSKLVSILKKLIFSTVPTFVSFLQEIESPYEVGQFLFFHTYLLLGHTTRTYLLTTRTFSILNFHTSCLLEVGWLTQVGSVFSMHSFVLCIYVYMESGPGARSV